MKYNVVWTEKAWDDLDQVFDFILPKSAMAAERLLYQVINRAKILEQHPQVGPIEPLLVTEAYIYRYLVVGHLKLIYRLTENAILIIRVFDTRQNPDKLQV